jgi:RNA polymerase sigma factor (sigma-70 family)
MKQDIIDLILQAQNGDKKAFEKLYNQYHAKLYQYISGLCYERNLDAEDVVQETFVQAWKKLGTLKEPKAFGSWLKKIAKNLIKRRNAKKTREKKGKQHLRNRCKNSLLMGYALVKEVGEEMQYKQEAYDPEQLSPMDEADRRETREVVRRQVRRLSSLHQKVAEEHYWNDHLVNEIAQELNKPEGTVKRLLYEARRQLENMLGPDLSF